MNNPRIMLAAGSSGSGKTLLTCGILQALLNRGIKAVSFKCGPDYIDPMFHSRVLGTKSRNLDTYFTDEETTRYLFCRTAAGADISVIEGVMGYYDGLGGSTVRASAYDLARVTDTPVVLIVNCKGMSLSSLACVKVYMDYKKDSRIKGVNFNQMSEALYQRIKGQAEAELGISCLGCVPVMKDMGLESRHLGLVMPDEIEGLRENLRKLADVLEKTLDLEGLLRLAGSAGSIEGQAPAGERKLFSEEEGPVIAVARDEAFCFLYEDNLELLRRMGAKIRFFSPLWDDRMPRADGLLLYGGYPELHAAKLSRNNSMRESIGSAIRGGMPCMAECGGFMYLHREMEDMEGKSWPMAGIIPGKAYRTKKLNRFGYISLRPDKEQMLGLDVGEIRAHEFHYFDSTACGDAFRAGKPVGNRGWDCIWGTKSLIAGFPHLYYYSNPEAAGRFLQTCAAFRAGKREDLTRDE